MKRGLYRTVDDYLGECARMHWRAGDGAPFLARTIYEALGCQPRFEALPTRDEYKGTHV